MSLCVERTSLVKLPLSPSTRLTLPAAGARRALLKAFATRAAVEEGIVPGGGVALLRAKKQIQDAINGLEGDKKLGAEIILRAVEAPAALLY